MAGQFKSEKPMTTSNNDLNYDEDRVINKNNRDKTKPNRRRIQHQSNRSTDRRRKERERKIQKIADSIKNKVNNRLNPSDRIVAFYANKFKEAKEKERAVVKRPKSKRKPKEIKTFEVSSKTREMIKIDPKNKKVEGKSLMGNNVTQPAVSSPHNPSTNTTNATATKNDRAAFSVAVGNRPSLVLTKRRFYRDNGKSHRK